MLPIPEKYVPRMIRQNRPLRLGLVLLMIVVFLLLLVQGARLIEGSLDEGPRFKSMDQRIARRLLDSAAVGIERYHTLHGFFPNADGKYFVDSIKALVNLEACDVYIYADTVGANGELVPILKRGGQKFPFLQLNHTYFGVGHWRSTIIYRLVGPDCYLLYWIGNNEIDEAGKGDDVVYCGGAVPSRQ